MYSASPVTYTFLLAAGLLPLLTTAADSKPSTSTSAVGCTATSLSGSFFDLRPDVAIAADATEGAHGSKHSKRSQISDYTARGYDYGYNFTLNICDPVVKTPKDVVGVDKRDWKNVAAYYQYQDKTYSLGEKSSLLSPRGTQLVLQYSGGSPCGSADKNTFTRSFDDWDEDEYILRHKTVSDITSTAAAAAQAFNTDTDITSTQTIGYPSHTSTIDADFPLPTTSRIADRPSSGGSTQTKSATFAFRCDRDLVTPRAAISFVSASPDQCAYFFIVRTPHACAGAEPHKAGTVGPGSVFVIMLVIAGLVYVVGGIFYQRNVANARGWRQLPNYSLWAGIWGFISDIFMILTSSCARLLPGRRGYRSLAASPTGRNRSREDENRLIDQLDEEWDD